MAVQTLQYHVPEPRVLWNTTQEKSISQDYPLVVKTPESGEDFTARTYFQFLWLPESIMPLGLFVPSLLRVQHQPTEEEDAVSHPLHELLERLLSTTRIVKNKYHEELPRILANGGGEGEEEESMMWYAVVHEKSEEDEDEPWHNETWRTAWMGRMERREVQIQILLYMLKLTLPAAPPPPETSSPSRKRRKVEPPPASLEDRLEAFMDKLSTWQLAQSLEEGLLHRSRDRDWMQVFCEDVVEPRFKATLPDQVELLRSKVFPHSPFSDSEASEDEQRATSPDVPVKRAPSTGLAAARKTLEEPARSRSLSITLAQEREREQQREGSVGAKRRVLTREVSMKRAFKPRERDDKSLEAQRKQREKEQEEEKAKAEGARLAAIRAKTGVTLVLATPVKSRSRSSTFGSQREETRGGSPDPLAMDI